MLKEAMQEFASIILLGERPQPMTFDSTKDSLVKLDGKNWELRRKDPTDRNHIANSIDTIVAFAHAPENKDGCVWYSAKQIVFFTSDKERFNRVTLPLSAGDQFKKLAEIERQKTAFEHKTLMRLFRFEFAGRVNDAVMNALKLVKWGTTDEAQSEITKKNASLGRNITQKIEGAAEIPDSFYLAIEVFSTGFKFETSVKCNVEADPDVRKIWFLPYPGELDRVIEKAEEAIRQRLVADLPEGYRLYHGTP